MYIYNMFVLLSNLFIWDNFGLLNFGVRLSDVEGVEDRGCDSWVVSILLDIEDIGDFWEDGGLVLLRCVGDLFFSFFKVFLVLELIV